MLRHTSRYVTAIGIGAGVTFGLLFIMQYMISSGQNATTDERLRRIDFVRVERDQIVEKKEEKPEPPPEPEVQPDLPEPEMSITDTPLRIAMVTPPETMHTRIGGFGFEATDGEYLPIVKVAPLYPQRAAQRGLEGYVVVQYTVTTQGTTEDITVIESSSTLFERAAIDSARRYKYRPRVIDGTPVAVPGVTTRIEFILED